MINSKEVVESYLGEKTWRINENSNATPSFGALNKHIVGVVSKDYWLRSVYPVEISQPYVSGDIHIHDLGGLSLYCCGYSIRKVIDEGVYGIPNIPRSSPAKHFGAILNQLANLITVYQNEILG